MLFDSRVKRDDDDFSFDFHYLLDGRTFIEFPDMINFYCATPFRLVLVLTLMDHHFVSPRDCVACFDLYRVYSCI